MFAWTRVVKLRCERWLDSRYNSKVDSLRSPDGLEVECEKKRIMDGSEVESFICRRHSFEVLMWYMKIHILYAHSYGSAYLLSPACPLSSISLSRPLTNEPSHSSLPRNLVYLYYWPLHPTGLYKCEVSLSLCTI